MKTRAHGTAVNRKDEGGTRLFWTSAAVAAIIVALTLCAPDIVRWLGL